jgi:hypothetical protein
LLAVQDVADVTYEAIKAKITEVETAEDLLPRRSLHFSGKEMKQRLAG